MIRNSSSKEYVYFLPQQHQQAHALFLEAPLSNVSTVNKHSFVLLGRSLRCNKVCRVLPVHQTRMCSTMGGRKTGCIEIPLVSKRRLQSGQVHFWTYQWGKSSNCRIKSLSREGHCPCSPHAVLQALQSTLLGKRDNRVCDESCEYGTRSCKPNIQVMYPAEGVDSASDGIIVFI